MGGEVVEGGERGGGTHSEDDPHALLDVESVGDDL
jgi:hypothetical protein